ncbi:hypothetical protein K2F54_00650 [Cryobacterium sp. 1639]|uniref:hypothetical protein n=1 Tax=Cryobacterium inferilacus TaxID=2866629 RepID=UPI001C73830E|nr:hypothetical protein [Cryobacterium sp. 1639]MBX0298485.1 hypothetical protein [Cryobacterium sp. 1639]
MLPSNLLPPTNDDFVRFEERLLDTVATRQTQRRRRHRTVLAAATALLLAGAGATAWVTLATPELQSLSTYCYAEANTDADVTQVGSPTDQVAPDGTVTSLAPVVDPSSAAITNCAAVWAIDLFGIVGNGGDSPLDDSAAAATTAPLSDALADPATGAPVPAAPRLQACLRPDGVYSVFPVVADEWNPETAQADDPDGFCATVGLQPPFAP